MIPEKTSSFYLFEFIYAFKEGGADAGDDGDA